MAIGTQYRQSNKRTLFIWRTIALISNSLPLHARVNNMFKGNKETMAVGNVNSPDKLNRIVEGTSIEGEIISEGNIRIDGKVKGTVSTKGRLVIGSEGNIEGNVICCNADVEGALVGTIKVSELLTLKSTAKLQGDIVTSKLSIEPGAVFGGTCNMGGIVKGMPKSSEDISSEAIREDKTA